ncbi:hypothetical protein G6514_005164 [Epicoccum nigrum]|nr:hypothetical protein G6514_005164 [Epicoccum nigrum]
MAPPAPTPITQTELIQTNAAMLALTSLFIFARIGIHIVRRKALELHDVFIYSAYVLYLALWICYRIVIGPMFRAYAVYTGERPPYPALMHDASQMLRLITAAQIVLSSVFTCNDLNEKFNRGKCGGTSNEAQRVIFSLYFAYAVDVLTDLMVMILPFHLTWNLQMSRGQKTGIFILFGTGFICILFATLRVIKLGVDGTGKPQMPEPKWMLLWTVLETSMAVIIGCSPAFAVIIRKHFQTRNASSRDQGYHTASGDVNMKSMGSATRPRRAGNTSIWEDGHSSQEALAKDDGKISVTTTIHQDVGRFSHSS